VESGPESSFFWRREFNARAERLLCPCCYLLDTFFAAREMCAAAGLAGTKQPLLVSAGLSLIEAKGAREK
jgi:hypothetical protein